MSILLAVEGSASKLLFSSSTMEPQFNEPLLNENLDITNGILCQVIVKYMKKEPRFKERIWPVPSDLVKWSFHCTSIF